MQIRIRPTHTRALIILIIALNFLMLAGTWAFHIYFYDILETEWRVGENIKYILLQFSLGNENTVATWYSSMLFLLTAVTSFFCFRLWKQIFKRKSDFFSNYGWLLFSIIFVLLSLDEIGSLHENIGNLNALNPFEDEPLGWYVVLGGPIALVGLLMLYFCFLIIKRIPWAAAFAIAGILLFLSIPFQEYLEMRAWDAVSGAATWRRPVLSLLLEEGSELFGVTFLFISTIIFLAYAHENSVQPSLNLSVSLKLYVKKKSFLLGLLLALILLAFLMIVIDLTDLTAVEADEGIPRNWFASATAFLTSLLSFYIFYSKKSFSRNNRHTYFLLALLSMFISAYYGSNLYNYFYIIDREAFKITFTFLLMLISVFLTLKQLTTARDFYVKTGLLLWLILFGAALSFTTDNTAVIAFLAFSVLLLTLFSQVFPKNMETNQNPALKKTIPEND